MRFFICIEPHRRAADAFAATTKPPRKRRREEDMRSAPRSRREVLRLAASGALAAMTLPVSALATPEQVTEEISKISGGKKIGEGKLKLDLPSIAENGLV